MSLKDELLKAKLISKKQVQKIEHDQRVSRKKEGREKLSEKERQNEEKIEQKRHKQKQRDKKLAKAKKQEQQVKEQAAQIRNAIRQGRIYPQRGRSKFYFVAKNGKIPFVLTNDDTARDLESGRAAIIEFDLDNCEFLIVSDKTAAQVEKIDPDVVRFLN